MIVISVLGNFSDQACETQTLVGRSKHITMTTQSRKHLEKSNHSTNQVKRLQVVGSVTGLHEDTSALLACV